VWGGAQGRDLIPVLAGTGRFELVYAALLALGLTLS
jgi:1,4-dihydroxy-2-naphthoate octaprenyltransferase